MYVKDVITQGV